jgi:hypothetical protein
VQNRCIEGLELLKDLEWQLLVLKDGDVDIVDEITEMPENLEKIKSLNEEMALKINDTID